MRSIADSIEAAQALVKAHVPVKKSIVDELLRERRKDAKSE